MLQFCHSQAQRLICSTHCFTLAETRKNTDEWIRKGGLRQNSCQWVKHTRLFPNYSTHKRGKKIAWLREEFLQLQYPIVVSLATKQTRQFSLHRLTYYYTGQNQVNRFRLTTGEKPAEISSVYTSANNRVALFQQPSPSLAEPSFKQWHSLSHAVHTHIHIRTHTHTHTHTQEIHSDQRIYRSAKQGGNVFA